MVKAHRLVQEELKEIIENIHGLQVRSLLFVLTRFCLPRPGEGLACVINWRLTIMFMFDPHPQIDQLKTLAETE